MVRQQRLRYLAGAALLSAALLVSGRLTAAQAPVSQEKPQEKAQDKPQERSQDQPAEKAFKNIKVLTGMPASQMYPVMHLMRASLGVRCDFCHVAENGKFDLDDKEEKETAREMIRMVLDINKNNFEGRTVVTCNTCHRGSEHPVSVPPIGQGQFADTTHTPAEESEEAERKGLPDAARVLDQYIQALGGRAALEAVDSRVSRGTLLRMKVADPGTPKARAVNRGQEDPIEIVQQAPNKMKVTLGPPAAQIVQTFDGTAGTLRTPSGERALTPPEIAHMVSQANLRQELELRDQAAKARVVGKDKIDGHEVYVLRRTAPDGNRESLYFDTQSGLLRRRIVNRPTLVGPDPEQTDYDDYRAVGGVKVPFLVKTSFVDDNHLGTTRKLTEVRDNVAVPAAAKPAGKSAGTCTSNEQCGKDAFCARLYGSCGDPGKCEERPTDCNERGKPLVRPVCGCDDKSYDNACLAAVAGVSVKQNGKCAG